MDPVILALLLGCDPCDADCRFMRARATFGKDDAATLAEIAAVDDPVERDMVRLRLAAIDPTRGGFLCRDASTDYGKARCEQVVGRPHLGGEPR